MWVGEALELSVKSGYGNRAGDFLSDGANVPQARGLVVPGGDDARAVRREGGARSRTVDDSPASKTQSGGGPPQ
jgi:hypothetical protein